MPPSPSLPTHSHLSDIPPFQLPRLAACGPMPVSPSPSDPHSLGVGPHCRPGRGCQEPVHSEGRGCGTRRSACCTLQKVLIQGQTAAPPTSRTKHGCHPHVCVGGEGDERKGARDALSEGTSCGGGQKPYNDAPQPCASRSEGCVYTGPGRESWHPSTTCDGHTHEGGCKSARGWAHAHDATVTGAPVWNCPIRWHHDFGGWRLSFCPFAGAYCGVGLEWVDNQPTYGRVEDSPPQKMSKYVHLEVPTGILTQPPWHTLP